MNTGPLEPSRQLPVDPGLAAQMLDVREFPLAYLQLDADCRILTISDSALALLGGTAAEALGKRLTEWHYLRQSIALIVHELLESLRAHRTSGSVRTEGVSNSEALKWVALRAEAPTPGSAAFLLLVEPTHPTTAEDHDLHDKLSLLNTLFDHSPLGKALVGLDGEFIKLNAAFCRLLGYTEGELRRLDFQSITHPEDLGRDLMKLHDLMDGRIRSYGIEKRYFKKDGSIVWVQLSVSAHRDSDGQILNFIAVVEDISARKRTEERYQTEVAKLHDEVLERRQEVNALTAKIQRKSMEDPVTGLLNAEGIAHEMARAFQMAVEDGEQFGLLCMSLKGFEEFVQEHGHDAGNKLLAQAGELLRSTMRRSDLIGRRHADNFVLALEQRAIHGVGVEVIVERIGRQLSGMYEVNGVLVELAAQVGIAMWHEGESLHGLMERAMEGSRVTKDVHD